jgi:hypothetical protein
MHTTEGLIVSSQAPLTGEFNLTGTAAQLPNVACQYGYIKAKPTNTGIVYIGRVGVTVADGATDTTSGYPLSSGESMLVPVNNLNLLYGIAATTGDDISYICFN